MGRREPFLFNLVPTIAEVMKRPYPEVMSSVPRIQTVIKQEEEQFLRNLENGLRMLQRHVPQDEGGRLRRRSRAPAAFDLHSTYGIPVEVTESLAAEQNLRVDMAGFEASRLDILEDLAGQPRTAAAVFTTGPLDTLKQSYHHGSEFLGYGDRGRRQGHRHPRAGPARRSRIGRRRGDIPIALVLDRTPFYGESGGQVGDIGTISGEGVPLRGLGHEEGKRFHPPPRPRGRGDGRPQREGPRRGRRDPTPGDPAGALGDARPPSCPAHPPRQARPAGREQGRAGPAPVRLRQPRGRRPRAAEGDRGDGE